MDVLTFSLEVLKIAVPGALCAAVVYIMLKRGGTKGQSQDTQQDKLFETLLPLKLRAFERVLLYLERIQPEALVNRAEPRNKTARLLYETMLLEITAEYEHNIVQQLYISPGAWQKVRYARDAMVALCTQGLQKVGDKAPGLELAKLILDQYQEQKANFPTEVAIYAIRADLARMGENA